ncbi:MAG: glutathione S-transferase family protein [Alphaproteobacteria bacterium]|jgi:GST-like protein|nr:glutathione S-transferase family protein [Alphaproteobacteria bacterium]
MFELHTWMTDNGYKARHMAEESGLDYELHPVNIREKEQFKPEFLKISPGHKIPAIIDHDGPGGQTVTLCESGAILKYLGQKADNGLYPSDPVKQVEADQWLFYGSAQFTTLAQQYGLFWIRLGEEVPRAKEHYEGVMRDMLGMYDQRLADREYVIGDYSVADIACYADTHIHGVNDIGLEDFPNVKRWHDAIEARPAVQKAWTPFG